MCLPKIYNSKKKIKTITSKSTNPENILHGCRMIILIDTPGYKDFIPRYCNSDIVENGLCEVHRDLGKF